MLSVTIRSCIEGLVPLGPGHEIVICDNSDPHIKPLLNSVLPTGYCRSGLLKVIHQDFPCLFSAREAAAREASGDYLMCLDSHMLVGHDSIEKLFSFMERRRDDPTMGFAHAPLSWAHQHEDRAKHDRDMAKSELGPWGVAYKDERTITWKGMPWICRRQWFLDRDKGLNGYGALAEHHVSWGGGDMHIGIKPWMLGFKNWAVPCRPCIHIGPFPKLDLDEKNKNLTKVSNPTSDDYRYRLYSSSGNFPHTFGFLVACYVLGGEPMMQRNEGLIREKFGRYLDIKGFWNKAIELGSGEKAWLDARKKWSFEELLSVKPWAQIN